jgi:hypothetical protein
MTQNGGTSPRSKEETPSGDKATEKKIVILAALITVAGTVIAAIITGVFSLVAAPTPDHDYPAGNIDC